MEKEFVPYDRALRLKELGFNELCFGSYYTDIDENNLGDEHDYRKTFNGLEYHPLDKWGASWEPNFIRNTESTYYVSAPTFSQAFRWFRENCGLSTYITLKMNYGKRVSFYVINELDNILVKNMFFKSKISIYYNSYEEAELACLDKLIEIVESKQKEDE